MLWKVECVAVMMLSILAFDIFHWWARIHCDDMPVQINEERFFVLAINIAVVSFFLRYFLCVRIEINSDQFIAPFLCVVCFESCSVFALITEYVTFTQESIWLVRFIEWNNKPVSSSTSIVRSFLSIRWGAQFKDVILLGMHTIVSLNRLFSVDAITRRNIHTAITESRTRKVHWAPSFLRCVKLWKIVNKKTWYAAMVHKWNLCADENVKCHFFLSWQNRKWKLNE